MVSLKAYKKNYRLPSWIAMGDLAVVFVGLILFPSDDSGRSIHTMCKHECILI